MSNVIIWHTLINYLETTLTAATKKKKKKRKKERNVHNTLRTGDADLRFYITTVQDG